MDYIFMTRSFWLELKIPKSIVKKKYIEYFGDETYSIDNRTSSINLLSNYN